MINVTIFGVPHGFDCSEGTPLNDISYYRCFYDSSKDNEKYVVHFRHDGKVTYNYLSYNYLAYPDNRPGAFIGISLVLDGKYHPDFLKVFRLLRLVFKEILVKSDTIIKGSNFVCSNFSDVANVVESVKSNIINNIAKDNLLQNNIKIQDYTKVYSIGFPKNMQEAENNQIIAQKLNAKYIEYIAKYSMLSFSGIDNSENIDGNIDGNIIESPIIEKHKKYTGEIANEFIAGRIVENIYKLKSYIKEFNSDAKGLEQTTEVKKLIEQYKNLLSQGTTPPPPPPPEPYTEEQKKVLKKLENLEDRVKEYDISVTQGKAHKDVKYILTLALKDNDFERLFVQLEVKKDKTSNWATIYDKASVIKRMYDDRLNPLNPPPPPIGNLIIPILAGIGVIIFIVSLLSSGSNKDYTEDYKKCLTEIQNNFKNLSDKSKNTNDSVEFIYEKDKIVETLKSEVDDLKEYLDQTYIDTLHAEIEKIKTIVVKLKIDKQPSLTQPGKDVPKEGDESKGAKGNKTPKQQAKVHIEIKPNDETLKKGRTFTFTVKCDDSSIDLTKGTWKFVCGEERNTQKLKGNRVEYKVPNVRGFSLDVKFNCQGTEGCSLPIRISN